MCTGRLPGASRLGLMTVNIGDHFAYLVDHAEVRRVRVARGSWPSRILSAISTISPWDTGGWSRTVQPRQVAWIGSRTSVRCSARSRSEKSPPPRSEAIARAMEPR